jgi:hypothetical protein
MPSAEYFLRQADLCLRLSLISSDSEISNRLIMMAKEYEAKARALKVSPSAEAIDRIDTLDEGTSQS